MYWLKMKRCIKWPHHLVSADLIRSQKLGRAGLISNWMGHRERIPDTCVSSVGGGGERVRWCRRMQPRLGQSTPRAAVATYAA